MSDSARFQIYAYYLLSIVVLSIFALRSPVSYLDFAQYTIIFLIALPYFTAALIRTRLEPPLLLTVAPLNRSRRQLYLDLGLFTFVGIILVGFELFVYRHPLLTAVKTGIWAMIIGYFASIDSALHRVRSSHDDSSDTAALNDQAPPVSQKLSIFLSSTVLLVIIGTSISAYGYLNIDNSGPVIHAGNTEQEFIVEMLFILGIIVTLTTRVLFSYSLNLQAMFETQIDTLRNVQKGELSEYVPVMTQDEFGVIAQQTNRIIDQLREKEKIQKTLGQVVSPNIMEKLLADSEKDLKKGQEFELAILFCDLRKFTSYAEHKAPDEVIFFLNAYFTKLADVIAEHNGIVNKFIGDALLAVFGVDGNPRYVENAVEAAWDILLHSGSAVMRDGTKFDTGIGIHCGRAAAGTIGSKDRFEYTFIGDSVNTASRLDGLSKRLHHKIIASTDVYERLPPLHRAFFTDLGEHQVRGKSKPMHLYGAVSDKDTNIENKIIQFSALKRSG